MAFTQGLHRSKTRCSSTGRALTLATTAALALVLSGGLLSCSSNSPSVPAKESTATNRPSTATAVTTTTTAALTPVPEGVLNADLQTLDGKSFQLADYAGKVVVLDLWATWCPPCRIEIPHLVELHKEFAAQGVEVIGLDVDPTETVDDVNAFAREFGINYKLGWADRSVAIALMGDNGSIPQTFVITRDGRILKRFIGFSPQKTGSMLRQAVEQAAKTSSGA